MKFYGTSPDKIHVVYPAVTPPTINTIDIRAKYHLPERYFVFIGTLQPRKNIARLVAAYNLYRQQTGDDAALVLAGGKGWLYDEAWTLGVEGVIQTGYIDDADKGILLNQAIGLVFPSLYEGFGFPVLEAMYSDTPVIASNTSSLPELVGEAGLLVNPLDTQAIADAMKQLAADTSLRQMLIARGREQVKKFSWEESARQVLGLLDHLK
jgi:glycosyltransferase involved in cell wall biosynthesis